MSAKTDEGKSKTARRRKKPPWYNTMAQYETPDLGRAIWQLVNTLVPYAVLWYVMVRTVQLGYSYWITLALSVLAAGFLVRIFIFFHDCTHGSFFASRTANRILGYITGILTFTAYEEWRHSHAIHHATAGDLDRRGMGDVWTLTVDEYRDAPQKKRRGYRLVRNPWVMFGLGPVFMFVVAHRFPNKNARPQERRSVLYTNLALLAIVIIASLTIGFWTYVKIQLPVIALGGLMGMWLFYVQHQFETVYWAHHDDWDPIQVGLSGSSYYRLPKVLQWFTGNIGLHHIHHLRARIPNYNLQRCYDEVPEVQVVKPLGFWESLKCVRFNLWDEARQKMVSFAEAGV